MSAFEVEGYIFTGTLVLSYLIKSAKWIVEETIDLIAQCKKLRTTLAGKDLAEIPGLNHSSTASQTSALKNLTAKPHNVLAVEGMSEGKLS